MSMVIPLVEPSLTQLSCNYVRFKSLYLNVLKNFVNIFDFLINISSLFSNYFVIGFKFLKIKLISFQFLTIVFILLKGRVELLHKFLKTIACLITI